MWLLYWNVFTCTAFKTIFFSLSPSQFWFLYSATSNIYQIPFPFCRKHAFVSYSFSLQHRKSKRILISYSIISVKYKVFHSYTVFTSTTLPRLGYSMKYLDIHVDLINIAITLLLFDFKVQIASKYYIHNYLLHIYVIKSSPNISEMWRMQIKCSKC